MLGMYLETTFQEIIDTESQDVIELHAGVVQDTNTDQTTNQGVTLEKTLGVLLVKSQKLTGSTTIQYPSATRIPQTYNNPPAITQKARKSVPNLGKGKLDPPDLSLVAETIFTNGLQLSIANCEKIG
jgi:hypothetical protein